MPADKPYAKLTRHVRTQDHRGSGQTSRLSRSMGKLFNGDIIGREKLQALFKILASMGLMPAREQLGNAYANEPVRDGQFMQPDYGVAASCYLAAGIESLGYDTLKNLAYIMSDPAKRPREYDKVRALEVYYA